MINSRTGQPWRDEGEYLWDVVIEDWGPTPGKTTLVLRTHLGTPISTIGEWRHSTKPTVATGGTRAMQRFLHDLEVAGARYSLMPAAENSE